MDGNGKVVAIVVAVIGALGAIIAAIITVSGSGSAASAGTPSPVASITATPTTASPAPVPAPTETATTAQASGNGGGKTCTMSVENTTNIIYVDFDTCTTSAVESAEADGYVFDSEIKVDDPSSTMYQHAELYAIKAGTGSPQNCPKGRAISGSASLSNDIGPDEDLCVSTSQGAWAVVSVSPDHRNDNPLTMNVTVYSKP